METLGNKKLQQSCKNYYCKLCDYNTERKSSYEKHINTAKHKEVAFGNTLESKSCKKLQAEHKFRCQNCDKEFLNRSGLWKHTNKGSCIKIPEPEEEPKQQAKPEFNIDKELMLMLINQNKELVYQNKELLEIVKNGTTNHSHNTTNSHNKAFNLNFFLNETCKNAMNMTDFVDSIKLQLSDLIDIGDVGFVEGISKIIVKNLNALDETIRPIHCADKKREVFYVKDQDQWEKEDEERKRIKKIINKIADKNINLLPQFREKYPEYSNSSSRMSDKYDKMVIEVMSTDGEKKDKIIKNISKATVINDK
jgi:hypothetical protein